MKLRSASLLAAAWILFAPLLTAGGELDQVSPYAGAWFYCDEPENVWQQQVRVGVGGTLAAFEVAVEGSVGSEVVLSLRVGDGWNVGPVAWSGSFVKTFDFVELAVFDVSAAGLSFVAGDTFVIEAHGTDTGAELVGTYLHPSLGPANYPEELFLSGPGCYEDCGWRIGFRTWMCTDVASELVRVGSPPNPSVLLPGVTTGPITGSVWNPVIDHTAFLPGATADWLAVSDVPGPVNLLTAWGTLLCDLSASPLAFTAAPGAPFAVPIPDDPALLGLQLCTQGISVGPGTLALTNALDITIGSS